MRLLLDSEPIRSPRSTSGAPHRHMIDAGFDEVRAADCKAKTGVPVSEVGLRVESDFAVTPESEHFVEQCAG